MVKKIIIQVGASLTDAYNVLVRLGLITKKCGEEDESYFYIRVRGGGGWKHGEERYEALKDIFFINPQVQRVSAPGQVMEVPDYGNNIELDLRHKTAIEGFEIGLPFVPSYLSPGADDFGMKFVDAHQGKRICVIHPITTWTKGLDWGRYWNPIYWQNLVEDLLMGGWVVAQIGAASDELFLHEGVDDFVGKLGVQSAIALLKRCHLFIGCDSWPALVAGWRGCKSLVFSNKEFALLPGLTKTTGWTHVCATTYETAKNILEENLLCFAL